MAELHQKEIWEWKQKESEYIQTKNLLDGSKRIIAEMSSKMVEQVRIIKELEQEIKKLLAEKNK
jgi:hypothetical protein